MQINTLYPSKTNQAIQHWLNEDCWHDIEPDTSDEAIEAFAHQYAYYSAQVGTEIDVANFQELATGMRDQLLASIEFE